jgi:SAM-dependent methyltransferase
VADRANADQIERWEGRSGRHWVTQQERYDRMLSGYGERLIGALAPQPGERVLDVGCGNGAISLAIAERVAPDGDVVGLDISSPMLELARRRAAEGGITNISFERGDAQVHTAGEASFDGVVSRFGVMFFDDPEAAFANLARKLRPGGRMVFLCWQQMPLNDWVMVPTAAALEHVPMPEMPEPGQPGPFALADADRVQGLLADAGLADVRLDEAVENMNFGESLDGMIEFLQGTEFAERLVSGVDDETAGRAWGAVRDALESRTGTEGVVLGGTAWLVTARRPT